MPRIPDLRLSRGPQITRLAFRTARPGELDDGRVADLVDEPGQRVVVIRPGESTSRLLRSLCQLSDYEIVRGHLRQPQVRAREARLTDFRLERLPRYELPEDRAALSLVSQEDGRWILAAEAGECSPAFETGVNEALARFAREQKWFFRPKGRRTP
ncbi:hypothetical protein [Streptomyces chartreusis]|uniref:hypothetical protein n=1 Tax=Streptomyces chartreusis TaxID=1969 RepID=UPI003635E548